MPDLITQTRRLLSELPSTDEFEALATAVLREAVPAYASLLHVGTNAHGRTVRSPVDGISIGVDRGSRRLLMVQHTITARNVLRRKWLARPDGDLSKALTIAEEEYARKAIRDATLVLATTSDPDEQLIRDVHAAAGDRLKVDFWPGSRIADFLDRDPEGQWLREQQFGTRASRLSLSQARRISRQSLDAYMPLVERSETVPRELDESLAEFAKRGRGTAFVIGESGLGKSVALRTLADAWLDDGGVALVLPHELVEEANTLEHAVALCLRQWAPALDLAGGRNALQRGTSELPVLLLVEDVNRSSNPRRIVERLIGWSISSKSSDGKGEGHAPPWRLLCPVWRGNAALADTKMKAHVMADSFPIDRFRRSESVAAIRRRGNAAGAELTDLECDDLAAALGDDPLLIGLNDDWSAPSRQGAIQSYVAASLAQAADGVLLMDDLTSALDKLTELLILERTTFPQWPRIRRWFSADADGLAGIRRLLDQGRLMRLESGGDGRLAYRHDRVRDHLLVGAVIRLIDDRRLPTNLWRDPYYAELIGAALAVLPVDVIAEAAALNPAALFAALREPALDGERRRRVLEAATAWTQSPDFAFGAESQRRHHAMRYLARTDGPFVAQLASNFPPSFPRLEALVRNGSVTGAASLCATDDPGMIHPWRDRLIAHAVSRHPAFVTDLAHLLATGDLPPERLEGALNLAGEIGDPALCAALEARWRLGNRRTLSTGWLWATLRCCPRAGHPLVDVICGVWAKLPAKMETVDGQLDRNPRWDIAGYSLPSAFARRPEPRSVQFLIDLSKRHRGLSHILSSILLRIDLPIAVVHCISVAARISKRIDGKGAVNLFTLDLQRNWSPDQYGRQLSEVARTACRAIWRDGRKSRFQRRAAFPVWSATPGGAEMAQLAGLEKDHVLADAALRTRLENSDRSAIPLLKARIWSAENPSFWWTQARRIGLAGLEEDVGRFMHVRRERAQGQHDGRNADHIVAELLMDARDAFAVDTVIGNWDHLNDTPWFVQAALHLATPETVALARSSLTDGPDLERMLAHIDSHWGIRTNGRAGVTELAQLEALEPYYPRFLDFEFGANYLGSFFEAANELGALEWRRIHLDPLISKSGRGCPHDRKDVFASLDGEVSIHTRYGHSWFAIDHWFELREQELWRRDDLLAIVGDWAVERSDENAARLLCEALLNFGERKDLTVLNRLPPLLRARSHDAIENCRYEVRRRSLQPE